MRTLSRNPRRAAAQSNQQLYAATITNAWVRNTNINGINHDYAIVIFSEDLPSEIAPLRVAQDFPYGSYVLIFRTCQHGRVS